MKNGAYFLLTLALAYCCYGADNIAYQKAHKLWVMSKSNPQYLGHLKEITVYNNKKNMDSEENCYSKEEGNAELILIHNALGIVTSAIIKYHNSKSECFMNLYLGKQFPVPPYSPFYEHVVFE